MVVVLREVESKEVFQGVQLKLFPVDHLTRFQQLVLLLNFIHYESVVRSFQIQSPNLTGNHFAAAFILNPEILEVPHQLPLGGLVNALFLSILLHILRNQDTGEGEHCEEEQNIHPGIGFETAPTSRQIQLEEQEEENGPNDPLVEIPSPLQ